MTLQQLKYVIEIVLCGSINEAAGRLYMSQPSLSKAVKELEKELGINIFLRTSKGITLSTDGAEFLGYARQVVEQLSFWSAAILVPHLPGSCFCFNAALRIRSQCLCRND